MYFGNISHKQIYVKLILIFLNHLYLIKLNLSVRIRFLNFFQAACVEYALMVLNRNDTISLN